MLCYLTEIQQNVAAVSFQYSAISDHPTICFHASLFSGKKNPDSSYLLLDGSLCCSVLSSAPAGGCAPESVSSGPRDAPECSTAEVTFTQTLQLHHTHRSQTHNNKMLTRSSSSCCLLFSSTAALRRSSFCLCSSSRFQRSSTVRSYCSRALRSFSLISCSRAAERDRVSFCSLLVHASHIP